MPKERGMIFSADSVRAILDGRKTQTRRVVTRQTVILDGHSRPDAAHWSGLDLETASVDPGPSPAGNAGPYLRANCDLVGDVVHRLYPQHSVGQRIWVRETYRRWVCDGTWVIRYREDGSIRQSLCDWDEGPDYRTPEDAGLPVEPSRWCSPIYMPRWASRITLEIAEVRVERLQNISEEDAKAEGVESHAAFYRTWDTLNGRRGYPWSLNPWVVALTFRRIDGDSD